MEIVFLEECAADGCYKKKQKGKGLCKQHQGRYDAGEKLKAFYGKTIQKKEFWEKEQEKIKQLKKDFVSEASNLLMN